MWIWCGIVLLLPYLQGWNLTSKWSEIQEVLVTLAEKLDKYAKYLKAQNEKVLVLQHTYLSSCMKCKWCYFIVSIASTRCTVAVHVRNSLACVWSPQWQTALWAHGPEWLNANCIFKVKCSSHTLINYLLIFPWRSGAVSCQLVVHFSQVHRLGIGYMPKQMIDTLLWNETVAY